MPEAVVATYSATVTAVYCIKNTVVKKGDKICQVWDGTRLYDYVFPANWVGRTITDVKIRVNRAIKPQDPLVTWQKAPSNNGMGSIDCLGVPGLGL